MGKIPSSIIFILILLSSIFILDKLGGFLIGAAKLFLIGFLILYVVYKVTNLIGK